ncbi:30S ribosomal protein S8 [Candidatus Vidania fulgoroideorum]
MNCFLISNNLISLFNAQNSKKQVVILNFNNLTISFLKYFYKKNKILKYKVIGNKIYVFLKKTYIFYKISFISKPSKRIYKNVKDLKKISGKKTIGEYILSTNKGILNLEESINLNIGGELFLYISYV